MGQFLPDTGQETGGSPSPEPVSSTIDLKISQVADKYHNPDPLLRLIGPANEATVVVEGQKFPALIDSGANYQPCQSHWYKLLNYQYIN